MRNDCFNRCVFLLLMLISPFLCIGQTPTFRIDSECKNEESFQVYVGKNVVFYKPESKQEKAFRLKGISFGDTYTIRSITTQEGSVLSDPKVILTLMKSDDPSPKSITIKCNNNGATLREKSTPEIKDIPMYFVDDFNNWKELYVGTEVSYDGHFSRINDLIWDVYKGYKDDSLVLPTVVYQDIENQKIYKETIGKREVDLYSVEKPLDERIRYGETEVIFDEGKTKYSYCDNVINIEIFADSKKFNFVLKNVSDTSIKLLWNEASFVNLNGSSCRVMHNGIKYIDRNGDQPASTIIKGAKLLDIIIPNDNVEFLDLSLLGLKSEWVINDMFSSKDANGHLSIMLPIQIKDTINEYIFVFSIRHRWEQPEAFSHD